MPDDSEQKKIVYCTVLPPTIREFYCSQPDTFGDLAE